MEWVGYRRGLSQCIEELSVVKGNYHSFRLVIQRKSVTLFYIYLKRTWDYFQNLQQLVVITFFNDTLIRPSSVGKLLYDCNRLRNLRYHLLFPHLQVGTGVPRKSEYLWSRLTCPPEFLISVPLTDTRLVCRS